MPTPFPDLLRDAMTRTDRTTAALSAEMSTLIQRRRPSAITTCTPETIRRWLRGEAVPARTNRPALASLLGLPLDEVMRAADAQAEQIRIARESWGRP